MHLTPFAVERWFNEYEFRTPIDIGESCARPLRVEELLTFSSAICPTPDLNAVRLGYIESDGRADLRAAIAALYPGARAEDVLITGGAIEANFLALAALSGDPTSGTGVSAGPERNFQPGDRVICAVPTYQQLFEVPRAQGARVSFWHLRPENGWLPDLDELRDLFRERTKAVIINFPNNPTGSAIDQAFLEAVAELCGEQGALLYSDEVYRGLPLASETGQPSVWNTRAGDRAVVGSLSKAYGLPGLRVGWLVAPPWLRRRAHEIRDYTSISSPALSEELALLAIAAQPAIFAAQRDHARRNLALVERTLAQSEGRLSWVVPREGVVGFIRYTADLPSRDFCRRLAEEYGTLVVPGDCFAADDPLAFDRYFRLGFGYETAKLEAGLTQLASFVRQLS